MKIALVVPGRFHAFDLARALIDRGHTVTVFTNYPGWAVQRFGLSKDVVRSFWRHGLLTRLALKLQQFHILKYRDAWFNPLFGRWASRQLSLEDWDIVHPWSGVAEEILNIPVPVSQKRLLMRGSAHIQTQAQLLADEEKRTQIAQDHPDPWIIDREQREYRLADKIVVLSTFAYKTFMTQNVPPDHLEILPLGSSLQAFRPTPAMIEARCQRMLSGKPLRILYVGALSFRKGLWDLALIAQALTETDFEFRFVGPMASETTALIPTLPASVSVIPKQPQSDLPEIYAWGDVFVFPTIEDGYAIVLAQAIASGLPVLATTNCAAPDLLRENETGWVLPIRSAEAFVEKLRWCAAHRAELAAMARRIPIEFQPRDWSDVALDFERICLRSLNKLTS